MALARPLPWRHYTVATVLAAVMYNSWPLGYFLNPKVGQHGLASELEAIHQPYNWLFAGLDVLSSLVVIVVAILIWRYRSESNRRWISWVSVSLVLFGLLTIVDALLPMRCDPSIAKCADYHHDLVLFAHGVSSIAASICLFVSLVVLWWRARRRSWVLYAVVAGYMGFALLSLISILNPGQDSWSQHYYISLCSVWIALVPSAVAQAL